MSLRFPFVVLFTATIFVILFFGCLSSAYGMEIIPDLTRRTQQVLGETAEEGAILGSEAVDGPVTVISKVVFGSDWDFDTETQVWLVGLSRLPGEPSLGMAVTWSQMPSGWFPIWKIQLRSQREDYVDHIDLLVAIPEVGHTYTSTISYDPRSGGCAVHIFDETADKLIYADAFVLTMSSSRFFLAAGAFGDSDDARVRVSCLDVYPLYVPVGVKLQATPESRPMAPLIGSFERTEPLLIHIDTPGSPAEGEYLLRIVHHDTGETRELGPVQATEPRISFVYPLTQWPGQATVALEYYSQGHLWLTSAKELSIGWLHVDFADAEVSERKDKLSLRMRVKGDAPVRNVPLKVTASLARAVRDLQTGQIQIRDLPPVVILDEDLDIDSQVRELSLSVDLPVPGSVGVWRMVLRVECGLSIDLRRFGTEISFGVAPSTTEVLASLEQRVNDAPLRISLDEEARLRSIARDRPRRIIFNNDGDDARAPSSPRTMENFLDPRIRPLVGSQVDTIIYDTTAGTFGGFSHATRIGEIFTTREGVYRNNITPELILRGTDPLQMVIDFARENGFEIFWAMRMNDTHDAYTEPMFSQFKKENPDQLFGSASRRPPYGAWSGVDYAEPLVRELAFRYIEEVAENYDVDGIFLDFFRHPVFFKRVAWGESITEGELDAMTELIRRIRNRLRELGAVRGRPFLLAVRVPDTLEYCRAIGLDLERWLAEGLVDMFMPGGYFRLNRWEESVELGRRYGVPVYPSLDESRVASLADPGAMDATRRSLEAYRARAMNVWHAGAAGIHLFNMFAANHPMLREIGSPETLIGKEKVYLVSIRGDSGTANPNTRVGEAKNFFRIPIVTPDSPLVLWENTTAELTVDVGEDIEAAREMGLTPVFTLQLHTAGAPPNRELEVRLNGHLLSQPQAGSSYLEYIIDPSWIRRGVNQLEIRAPRESEQALHLKWAGPAVTANALGITELGVMTPDPHSLRLRIGAEASGEAIVGSVLIRLPNKGDVDPIPPGFDVIYGGYRHPKGWTAPGFRFNGPFDEEPDDENVFVITLPMIGAKPDEYTLRIHVTNRPAPGDYYDDSRLVRFRVDEQGVVRLPAWYLYDVQLWVRYD